MDRRSELYDRAIEAAGKIKISDYETLVADLFGGEQARSRRESDENLKLLESLLAEAEADSTDVTDSETEMIRQLLQDTKREIAVANRKARISLGIVVVILMALLALAMFLR